MTRAADDFPVIRVRLEQLRDERRVAADNDRRRADGPRSYDADYDDRPSPDRRGATPQGFGGAERKSGARLQ